MNWSMANFLPRSLAYFIEVIRGLKDEGCDAVVLACTEIPLLVTEEDSSVAGVGFDAAVSACGGAEGGRGIKCVGK